MGIGASIFLMVVGAILAFAVNADAGWLDIEVVGWVMLVAGAVGFLITLWYLQRSREGRVVRRSETTIDDAPPTV
ncbi:DUF6458 family protein [Pilimelia columellifera]|uniref:DUF6458 domain-containing protein n=1 Tax=Pilimelia columellifera subsp. columellifera TaxID=706583 RepID=A0ABN3N1I2_9ACTN